MLFHFRAVPLKVGMNPVAMELDQDGQIAIQEGQNSDIPENNFTFSGLKNHISAAHEEKNPQNDSSKMLFLCFCQDRFATIEEMREHFSSVHEEKIPQNESSKMLFLCFCQDRFATIEEMRVHFSSVHEEKKPQNESMKKLFKCSICEGEFAKIEELAEHISSVHEKKNPMDWIARPPKGQLISE
jgi:hypothetical protein